MISIPKTDEASYEFQLREDMPKGFIHNLNYPELPAIRRYLNQYSGRQFSSTKSFREEVLDRFLGYLTRMQVPEGDDPRLREGLKLEKITEPMKELPEVEYWVFTPATNGPGMCVFGYLKKVGL